MPVVVNPDSEYGKELAKWNVKRPFAAFPKMLYRAQKRPDGIVSVQETDDRLFGGNPGAAEAWTATCQKTVKDEYEMQKAMEGGWRKSHAEALEHFEKREQYKGNVAAHRAYEDRNMSEAAKSEAAAVEASTEEHVPEIPEKRRPGRPRKNVA